MLINNSKNRLSVTFLSMQSGFALLEVLITVVIISIGLLGLAGLQVTALNHNHSAYQRSQATALAYDITDRIRANTLSVDNYLSSFMAPTVAASQASCFNTNGGGCSAALMAQHDLFEWNAALTSTLPNGSGTITVNGELYTISVVWDENRDSVVDGNDPLFDMSFTLE
jgi:type IV pilus assembly protein PilV